MRSLVGIALFCLVGSSLCAPEGGLQAMQGGIRLPSRTASSSTTPTSLHKSSSRVPSVPEGLQKRRGITFRAIDTLTPVARSSTTPFLNSAPPSEDAAVLPTPTSLPGTHTRTSKSELSRKSASPHSRTSPPAKRGLSHSDPNLPLGSQPGVSASTEPPVLSPSSSQAPSVTDSSSVSAAVTAVPPIQSHPEQGRPSKTQTHKTTFPVSRRDLKIREGGETSLNAAPTPAPTGPSSADTTVHITDETDFALLMPGQEGESIGDAEADGVAYCSPGSPFSGCSRYMQDGFITAAALAYAPDNTSWIQITGCLDPSKMSNLDPSDKGGQFDVRFPNGAQCSFGGYGASFIELMEPAGNRFCIRCCANANDQTNCNSHQDRTGCPNAVPGTYDFPEKGISCSG